MRLFCARVVAWTAVLVSGAFSNLAGGAERPTGPTNAVVSAQPFRPQPESTRKMVQRLENIRKRANPFLNPFLSDLRAEALQAKLGQTTNAAQQVQLRYELGRALTEAGQPEAALVEYKKMEDLAASSGQPLDENLQIQLRMRKCIALLRLGEQENCLMNHDAVSCIFPLQPAAFHQLPRGSRGAIVLLDEQLKLYPTDLGARWLLNIAHMTLGEYPDKVPAPWLIPPKVFASDCDFPHFPNVAGALGLDVDGLAGGVILDDFDNDGFIDIVISNWAWDGDLRYFHNDGNGHFTERTKEAGLLGLSGGINIQQTDYNNDGLPDIWMSRGAW
ncbi:MAG TPA: VCBS repeat-containing protein [Verrucomicrobiae bacterium]|nr:VCBS repeat-containing protein [Verrucomicrobiae bacterium]